MSSAPTAPRRHFRGRLARTMLFILLPLSLGPLLLVGSLAYLRARTLLRDQVVSLLSAVVDGQSQRINQEAHSGKTLLIQSLSSQDLVETLAQVLQDPAPSGENFTTARHRVLNRLQSINYPKPYFNQFLVVLPDGKVVIASNQDWEGSDLHDSPLLDANIFLQPTNEQISLALYAPEPFYSTEDHRSLVMVTYAPFNVRGARAAIILGITESQTIRSWIDGAVEFSAEPPSSSHYIMTAGGQLVGPTPYSNTFSKIVGLQASPTYVENILQGLNSPSRRGVQEILSYKDQPVMSGYTWMPDLGAGWLVEVPQSSVYGQINSLLWFALALLGGMFTVMALALWIATGRLVRPLLILADTVQLFAEGNWEQRAPITRDDEVGWLAYSFNQMANELTNLYRSLETKVEERTYQIRTVSEITRVITTATDLNDLYSRVTRLLIDRFGLAYAAAYIYDETSRLAISQQVALSPELTGSGLNPEKLLGRKEKIDAPEMAPHSLVEWSILTKQARTASLPTGEEEATTQVEDLFLVQGQLLPGVKAAAAIPILLGDQVLGTLDLQATEASRFNAERLGELQTLTGQIASAAQNFHLLESTQINLQETSLLYQASHQIAQAEEGEQIFQIALEALLQTPYLAALLIPRENGFEIHATAETPGTGAMKERYFITSWLSEPVEKIENFFNQRRDINTPVIVDDLGFSSDASRIEHENLPHPLVDWSRQLGCETVAFLPVMRSGRLAALMALGANPRGRRKQGERTGLTMRFTPASLQPYINLAELTTTSLEKIQALHNLQKGLAELQTLSAISQVISAQTDLDALYHLLHEQINQVMGAVSFLIALYDPQTGLIEVPYIDGQNNTTLAPFPLGQGLTSILIRTRQPLMIVKDMERRAEELGAIISGKPARSWLGVPLLVGGEAIGAMIIQDPDRENRFTENDQRLMNILSSQVGVALRNVRLLENAKRKAEREELLYRVTSKIRSAGDVKNILAATATELALALGARRAEIQVGLGGSDPEASLEASNPENAISEAAPNTSCSGKGGQA